MARRLPIFPTSFDGTTLRHQLYSLALTYFREVRHNFCEHPSVLTNRSGELWSPLVALAAFFEKHGEIAGLQTTIIQAAAQNEVLGDGRALNSREEAVLQALELLMRDAEGSVWIESRALREQVGAVLGLTTEPPEPSAWMGPVLKRLHLTDRSRRRVGVNGQRYAIDRAEMLDLIQRYGVAMVEPTNR